MALDKKVAQTMNDEKEDILAKLLENVPAETEQIVNLPSENRFYNGVTQVSVKPMTFDHEKSVIANIKKDLDPINILLADCVKGINVSELLIFDKVFLLMKLRQISYGEDYRFKIECPKCSKESEIVFPLSRMIVNSLPEDLKDPREITLPICKKKIKIRFPRVKDEVYLATTDKLTDNLYRFVDSVENIRDLLIINAFIKKLPLKDIKTLINELNRPDLGLDPRFIFECGHCGKDTELSIPITSNFFSVT
jgi:hypothetical protein